MKLADLLNTPLPSSETANESPSLKRALTERQTAADALQCVDAHTLCIQSELTILIAENPDLAEKLSVIVGIARDLKEATTVAANEAIA